MWTHRRAALGSPPHETTCDEVLSHRGDYCLPRSTDLVRVFYCPTCRLITERHRDSILHTYVYPVRVPVPVPAESNR